MAIIYKTQCSAIRTESTKKPVNRLLYRWVANGACLELLSGARLK